MDKLQHEKNCPTADVEAIDFFAKYDGLMVFAGIVCPSCRAHCFDKALLSKWRSESS